MQMMINQVEHVFATFKNVLIYMLLITIYC